MKKTNLKDFPVKVSAETVARVLPFAATNDIRFYLNGVALFPLKAGGVLAAATNGQILLAVRDDTARAPKTTILPFNKRTHGRFLKKGHDVYVDRDRGISIRKSMVADLPGFITYICPDGPIDARFPDISALLGPQGQWKPGFPADAIQAAFVESVAPAAVAATPLIGKWKSTVRFYHRKAEAGPTLFTIGSDSFGVLMPVRDDGAAKVLSDSVPSELWGSESAGEAQGGAE